MEASIIIIIATLCGIFAGFYFVAGVGVAMACIIGFGVFCLGLTGIAILFTE